MGAMGDWEWTDMAGCSPAWDLGACTVEQSGYCILNENNDNSVRITKSCSVAWLL